MATIVIPDAVHAELSLTAAAAGYDVNQLAAELLAVQLEEIHTAEIAPTPELILRMKESLEQLRRGEGMTYEETKDFFAGWAKEYEPK